MSEDDVDRILRLCGVALGAVALATSAALFASALTGCATEPLIERGAVAAGAVQIPVSPTTNVEADAVRVLDTGGAPVVAEGAVALVHADGAPLIDTGGAPLVSVPPGAVTFSLVVEEGAVSVPVDKLGPSIENAVALASDNVASPIAQVLSDNARSTVAVAERLVPIGWTIAIAICIAILILAIDRARDTPRASPKVGD